MYISNKYFTKDASGNVREWYIRVDETDEGYGKIIISSGIYGSTPMNTTNIIKEGKNIGKKNETTPYQQALKEAQAKEKLKLKHGYKTKSMLGLLSNVVDNGIISSKLPINKTDFNNILKPMKAVVFTRNKMHYPAIAQVKINGFRTTSILVSNELEYDDLFASNKSELKLLTKEGHEYVLPHITNAIRNKLTMPKYITLDGEIYVHGEILSNIRRRLSIKKKFDSKASRPSLDPNKAAMFVFDLNIPDMNQLDRINYKNRLLQYCNEVRLVDNEFKLIIKNQSPIYNVIEVIVNSDEEVYNLLEMSLKAKFEGIIVRDLDAEYMFGGRRINMMKLKKSKQGEFKLLDIIKVNESKISDNNRTYILFILKNDITDTSFKCSIEGDENMRLELLNNKEKYIGRMVTATYFERTINDKPFQAIGRIRDSFDLDINDLNIE